MGAEIDLCIKSWRELKESQMSHPKMKGSLRRYLSKLSHLHCYRLQNVTSTKQKKELSNDVNISHSIKSAKCGIENTLFRHLDSKHGCVIWTLMRPGERNSFLSLNFAWAQLGSGKNDAEKMKWKSIVADAISNTKGERREKFPVEWNKPVWNFGGHCLIGFNDINTR